MLETSDIKYIHVKLSKVHAIVVDVKTKRVKTLQCTNISICRDLGILINEKCPGYCEAIVEAKNFAFGRRKPKGEVYEVDSNKLDILPLTVL
jgi:hypothetical protein